MSRGPARRGLGRAGLVPILCLSGPVLLGPGCGAEPPAPHALEADERFAVLLAGCERDVYYDVETADVCAILVATLVKGQRDPLKFAKAELAFGPSACREEVRRVAERFWGAPGREAYVRNALDVALLADDDVLDSILRRAIDHPVEGLRTLGLQGLSKHGGPEDYEAVLGLLASAGRAEVERALVTLHDVDPERAEAQFAEWLREGQLQDFWSLLAPRFARATSPAFLSTAQELVDQLPRTIAPSLWVALANAGVPGAPERLAELLRSENGDLRARTVQALSAGGRHRDLEPALLDDEEARVRIGAASALAELDGGDPYRGWFRRALEDRDPTVRAVALRKLVEWGDPEARELALSQLGSDEVGLREAGFAALRAELPEDPALAARAFERLYEVYRPRAHRPVAENLELLKHIGSVPDERAARLLIELARTAEGEVAAMSLRRWLLRAASNGGSAGERALALELERSTDPLYDLDVLEALAGHDGDVAREALIEFVLDEEQPPLLVLYAADRLARIGPATTVLPILKRVFLRSADERARRGLQCLLWHWYPAPLAGG